MEPEKSAQKKRHKKPCQSTSKDDRWLRTHCGRMDQGGCGLLVNVKNGRIVRVKGDPDHPRSQGYICSKGLASPERLNHPARLRSPLRRIGSRGEGRWEKISWEEALDYAAERFNKIKSTWGARAVAFCQGTPKGLEFNLLFRLANTFGSPNVVGISNMCHVPRDIAGRMTMGFSPIVDYSHSAKCYLIWGSNLLSTNEEGLLTPLLMNRLKEGPHLIVVDPLRTKLAERASLWLQLRPGTDVALALGFLHIMLSEHLYEEDFVNHWTVGFHDLAEAVDSYTPARVEELTWIPSNLIQEAARLYAGSRPAALQWGNALEHTVQTFDTLRAVLCLMAITGNLDVPGGNFEPNPHPLLPPSRLARFDLLPDREKKMMSHAESLVPGFPVVPPPFFTRTVLSGKPYPLRGAYVQGTNPVMAWANTRETIAALKSLDFLCVSEIFMTPTAALADLVLPAATHFEFDDIGHYRFSHGYVLAMPKIVEPPDFCWSDVKILNGLANYLGLRDLWWGSTEQMLAEILAPAKITYAEFSEIGILLSPVAYSKYKTRGFATPSGRVELSSEPSAKCGLGSVPSFDGFPEPGDADFPLLLSSAKNPHYFHSAYRQLPGLRKKSPEPLVLVHPQTAAKLQLQTGQHVQVETKYGQIVLTAKISDAVHPKVVYSEHGWYFPEAPETELFDCLRSNLNVLTSNEHLGKAFGTPNLRALPCRLSRV